MVVSPGNEHNRNLSVKIQTDLQVNYIWRLSENNFMRQPRLLVDGKPPSLYKFLHDTCDTYAHRSVPTRPPMLLKKKTIFAFFRHGGLYSTIFLQTWRSVQHNISPDMAVCTAQYFFRHGGLYSTIFLQTWRSVQHNISSDMAVCTAQYFFRHGGLYSTIFLQTWRSVQHNISSDMAVCTAQYFFRHGGLYSTTMKYSRPLFPT
ncbi:hypothetical protein RRG08_030014 [Elysia crispata]|uniref:Uncharacterized protein n=1 Tax=Elysia crispata TaxID=231223 RepID=A0AAE0XYD4_9GAST|nr:hypothetical protein RRG08_030014 [Elysia crispata]